jgi:uncharacterized protein
MSAQRPFREPEPVGNGRLEFEKRLVSFLGLPASYPHRPSEVRSIQTHISWVFVAAPFVFKVKKPVNLGFLDFSTLEKRRHFCRRELDLNRRLCPEIYLDVVPIYKVNSSFSFDAPTGPGDSAAPPKEAIAEYCVKMKQLSDGFFLNELLEKNLVGEQEINRAIACLRPFYASEMPSREIEQWGTPDKLKISTDENFAQVEPFLGKTISPAAFETTRHFTNEFYIANGHLFRERIQQHRIRDCHGDLHLDHVHITPDTLSIFDCIEFNDRLRFIDIANDLAFLAMDFDFEGRSDLATLLMRKAAGEFDDAGMVKLADFYKCYRAFVRGKVESIQANILPSPGDFVVPLSPALTGASRPSLPAGEREKVGTMAAGEILGQAPRLPNSHEHTKQAVRYFRLALRYAVSGSEPLVLVVIGRVGTGKTTVAGQLGIELGWPVFSSDEIRKTLAGMPLTERTPQEQRDQLYSAQMTQQTYTKLVKEGLTALETHPGVVLDATFSTQSNRKFLRDECKKANIRLQVIEVDVDVAAVRARLRARDQGTGEISDARLDDLEKLNAAYEPPSELAPDLIKIQTSNDISDSVKAILLRLAEKQSRAIKGG